MGTYGKKIVGLDVNKLVKFLNKALADEWLAYFQYWIGARVAEGKMRGAVVAELQEHAGEELEHADMLVERILQLGGKPLLSPDEWNGLTNCGYEAPENFNVKSLLKQNIKAEQCAIKVYKKLVEMTKDTDVVSYNMVVEIMTDEIEHEDELQALLEDMK